MNFHHDTLFRLRFTIVIPKSPMTPETSKRNGGQRNMKYKPPCTVGIFLVTIFTSRGRGGREAWPLALPLDLLLGMDSICIDGYFVFSLQSDQSSVPDSTAPASNPFYNTPFYPNFNMSPPTRDWMGGMHYC